MQQLTNMADDMCLERCGIHSNGLRWLVISLITKCKMEQFWSAESKIIRSYACYQKSGCFEAFTSVVSIGISFIII